MRGALSRIRVFSTRLGSWYSLGMTTNEPTTAPNKANAQLLLTNVTATDKRVAMLCEMVQACEIIAERFEDRRNEVAELRERLADATQLFNDAVTAAFAAGLAFDDIDKAAKRFGLQERE